MVVGILSLDLLIPGNRSLKGKRMVLNSMKARLRNKFNVAVAEVGAHDMWDRAEVGLSTVSTDTAHAHSLLMGVIKIIERMHAVDLLDYSIEML